MEFITNRGDLNLSSKRKNSRKTYENLYIEKSAGCSEKIASTKYVNAPQHWQQSDSPSVKAWMLQNKFTKLQCWFI